MRRDTIFRKSDLGPKDEAAEELAKIFAPTYLVRSTPIHKSFRKQAFKMGKPVLVFEGGESLRYDAISIGEALSGLRRVLYSKGMFKDAEATPGKSILFNKTTWMRAPRSGLFYVV